MAAFNKLPMEMHEQIATYLETDEDFCSFTLICPESHNSAHSARSGVWRALYANRFDLSGQKDSKLLMTEYMRRSRELRRGARFEMGQTRQEINCMEILRALVIESYADTPVGVKAAKPSKNLMHIRRALQTTNFLDNVLSVVNRSRHTHPLLRTLQLIFTHWQLDTSLQSRCCGFSYSQQAVYMHPNKASLFLDKKCREVNIDQLLHTANFFKSHIKADGEHLLFDSFNDLDDREKPGVWDRQLFQGPGVKKLGRKWKGSYGYLPTLDEVSHLRSINLDEGRDEYFVDVLDSEEGAFGTLNLDFSLRGNRVAWPKAFEDHLHALPPLYLCKMLNPSSNDAQSSQQQQCLPRPTNLVLRSGTRIEKQLESPPLSPVGTAPSNQARCTAVQLQPATPPILPLTSPRKGIDFLQFSGTGTDCSAYNFNGILHPLLPQQGIPGWQRLSMMKYTAPQPTTPSQTTSSSPSSPQSTMPPSSSPSTASPASTSSSLPSLSQGTQNVTFGPPEDEPDLHVDGETWAYEGIVLPGGAIILGRWWSPLDDEDRRSTGPFIFWNVPDED